MIARLFTHSPYWILAFLLWNGTPSHTAMLHSIFTFLYPFSLSHRRTSLEHSFIYSHLVSAPISRSFLNSHSCRFIICNTYPFCIRVDSVCLKQLQSSALRSFPVDSLCVVFSTVRGLNVSRTVDASCCGQKIIQNRKVSRFVYSALRVAKACSMTFR